MCIIHWSVKVTLQVYWYDRHLDESFSWYNRVLIGSQFPRRIWASASTKRRNSDKRRKDKVGIVPKKKLGQLRQLGEQRSLIYVYENRDPLGWKDLGNGVIKWICQG